MQGGATLKTNFLINTSIGLSQWTITMLVRLFFRGRMPAWSLVIAIPAGFVLGSRIASLTGAPPSTRDIPGAKAVQDFQSRAYAALG